MHKAVVEIRHISEAKVYVFIQFARHLPLPKMIWPTLYHTMRSLDVMPCPIFAGHGNESAWNAFCSNPELLANLGKGDFHDETYSSYPRRSSAGCSIFLMRVAVIMHGWLCLASAEYLKRCHLPTGNAPQLHIQRAHYQSIVWIQATCNIPLFHHNQRHWDGQRATGHLFPPWCH